MWKEVKNMNMNRAMYTDFNLAYSRAIAFSAEPIQNEPFAVRITRQVRAWSGSLEIGIVYGDLEEAKTAPSASLAKDSVVVSGKEDSSQVQIRLESC